LFQEARLDNILESTESLYSKHGAMAKMKFLPLAMKKGVGTYDKPKTPIKYQVLLTC
jgi:hypothetical protein